MPPYRPQLATLVRQPPEGDQWLHEIKYDGYRIGCLIDSGKVQLLSRRGKDWSEQFPSVVAAAKELPVRNALLDGEVAVVGPDGRTDFHALQGAVGRLHGLTYFVFDLLHIEDVTIAREPLEARKVRLRQLLAGQPPLMRYSDHVVGNGGAVFEAAKRLGTEGVVSKLRTAPHRAGRSDQWLKTKAVQRQEFVVAGYLVTVGAPLAALLLGYYDEAGQLFYAGKVGTGFQRVERQLTQLLDPRLIDACPFGRSRPKGADYREARWVSPELVVEIEFLEWTPDDHLRHPSFKGLRDDKVASEVRREISVDPADVL